MEFKQVQTYIQSGNVVFEYKKIIAKQLAARIEQELKTQFGFDVPTIVLEKENIESIFQHAPKEKTDEELYFTILENEVSEASILNCINAAPKTEDYFEINNQVVYVFCKNGYGNTKLTNTFFEKKLSLRATTRNRKTMETLLGML